VGLCWLRQSKNLQMLDVEYRATLAQCGVKNDGNGITRLARDVVRQIGHTYAQTQIVWTRSTVQGEKPHNGGARNPQSLYDSKLLY